MCLVLTRELVWLSKDIYSCALSLHVTCCDHVIWFKYSYYVTGLCTMFVLPPTVFVEAC
jgi:hypothetical protein